MAEARRAHSADVEVAQLEWGRRIDEAVRNYAPATGVWNAVKQTVSDLRTELEIYKAVTEAADFAVEEASSTANAADRVAAGQARDVAALEARAATARARYEAADRAYQATVQRRPEEIEAEGFGAERLGAFVQGLGARLGGDEEAAAAADRAGEEAFQARLDAIAEADAANEAAEAQYAATVAEARAKREEAYAAYRTAADAARRSAVGAAGADEAHESAFRDQEAALEARRSTFLHAAKVTRVYEAAELSAVERALTAGALGAIAEFDAAALAEISEDAARNSLDSALEAYTEPRRNIFGSIDTALADYDRKTTAVHQAEMGLATAEKANEETRNRHEVVLTRIIERYLDSARVADRQLENSIVFTFEYHLNPGRRHSVRQRTSAAVDHEAAMKAARDEREQAVARAFPQIRRLRRHIDSYYLYYRPVSAVESSDRRAIVNSIEAYKSARSRADAQYKATVLRALNEDTGDLGDLKNRVRSAAAAREAARRAKDTSLARAEAGVAFDEDAVERVRVLERAVRDRLVSLSVRIPEP